MGPAPGASLAHLARREAAFVAAAAEALFPRGGAVPPSGLDAGVVAWVDRWLGALPAGTRLLVRALFALVEHATLLFPAPGWDGWRRFSSLDAERRGRCLEAWRTSRLFPRRLVFTSLRAIATQPYEGRPACIHLGPCLAGCAQGAKGSTDVTYWPAALRRGARLRTRCRVCEVTLDGDRKQKSCRGFTAGRFPRPGRFERGTARGAELSQAT